MPFCICTDGPKMYQTHVYQEKEYLTWNGILRRRDVDRVIKTAFAATLIR